MIGVAGIGPKLGVGILSSIRPREFIRAVQLQDLKTLTTVPGIGKKTGERILLELKDKFTDLDWEQGVEEDLPIVSGSIFEDAVCCRPSAFTAVKQSAWLSGQTALDRKPQPRSC